MNIINSQKGKCFNIRKGQTIKIIDLEGEQVADFWAFNSDNCDEYFSAGVTIDCNDKLLVSKGDILYTNLYNPLFKIVEDTTGVHDLIHPCCRQEMYNFSYNNSENHPSCLENLNNDLLNIGKTALTEINPLNIFMNTKIFIDGKIKVEKPITKPGDYIILESLIKNVTIMVAACSVDSGNCNGSNCTSLGVDII